MNHSIFFLLIIISLLQSGSWLIRKKIINIKKMNNKSIIVAESVLISIILFSYIFMTENAKEIKKDLKGLNKIEWVYLILTSIFVVGAIIMIFNVMPLVEISRLAPTLSIIRIIILTIFGFIIFGEKITIRKVIALLFMITGICMLMNSK
tara:strand:- start:3437 stop:3886 length:450 start_codon:yes stop_codon:yes gene_type:complete